MAFNGEDVMKYQLYNKQGQAIQKCLYVLYVYVYVYTHTMSLKKNVFRMQIVILDIRMDMNNCSSRHIFI